MRGVDGEDLCAYFMRMKTVKTKLKKPLNVLVEAKLLEDAKNSGVNFSALIDKALRQEIAKRWASENAKAIQIYNDRIEREGLWLDEYRTW
jgi:antitoxin CcdA